MTLFSVGWSIWHLRTSESCDDSSCYEMNSMIKTLTCLLTLMFASSALAGDTLVFEPVDSQGTPQHIVLVAGDEEYRTEESMPMLGKILSQRHGFKCTVVFSLGADGGYIDANNQQGLKGLEALDSADLMLIGTRFRQPDESGAKHITDFLNAGKPVVGIRTSTHAFRGGGKFGNISFDQFGRKVLGEQWVSHHGRHKGEGARGVIEEANAKHPILNNVKDVFAPSDVYGVTHLTDADRILLRGAVTESLDPSSKPVEGKKNDPMQPLAWLHSYTTPDGKGTGTSFCTTAGASVDFLSEDLRRLIVNAVYHLTGKDVPEKADVTFVDPFYPSFYGFIRTKDYWKNHNVKPEDHGLGNFVIMPDPPGTPDWTAFRPKPPKK